MPPLVEVGTILIEEQPLTTQRLGLATEPYFANWNVVTALDGFALDRKARAAGWNFFFMAGEVKAMFWGLPEPTKIRNAVTRILKKVRRDHFNGLEVTEAVGKHFFGIPYTVISAHSRHIQQGCILDSAAQRQGAAESAANAEVELVFPPGELNYESR
ncbi:MAG: hypothetical protein ABSD20_00960 [Terriglobales bacterium]|jgi:hypothetical protein